MLCEDGRRRRTGHWRQHLKETLTVEVEEELPWVPSAMGGALGYQPGRLYGPRYFTSLLGMPGSLGMAQAADHKGCGSVEEVSEGKTG